LIYILVKILSFNERILHILVILEFVNVEMLEAQFPNDLKNKELENNAEYLAKQLLQHIYYVKRKE